MAKIYKIKNLFCVKILKQNIRNYSPETRQSIWGGDISGQRIPQTRYMYLKEIKYKNTYKIRATLKFCASYYSYEINLQKLRQFPLNVKAVSAKIKLPKN